MQLWEKPNLYIWIRFPREAAGVGCQVGRVRQIVTKNVTSGLVATQFFGACYAILIAVHLPCGAVLEEVLRFSAAAHLAALAPSITLKRLGLREDGIVGFGEARGVLR